MTEVPRVGIGILVLRDGKMLLGLRKGSHGANTWAAAGGHLEFGESFEECGRRELLEEAGDVIVTNVRFGTASGDMYPEVGRHYVTILMLADHVSGEPVNMEPEKCERWAWFGRDELPENLFPALKSIFGRGFDPFSIYYR